MALFLVMLRYESIPGDAKCAAKGVLVAARSLPTCSRYILALRGNVFYEVTRSLRTSAAEISVLARVLPTLERSAFAQPVQAVALRCRLAFLTCLV